MSYADTRKGLESRLATGWTNGIPIKWENVAFEPPKDANGDQTSYIAMIIRSGHAEDIVLGADTQEQRYHGIVMVMIFTPEKIGMGTATSYAELIQDIYLSQPRNFQHNNSGWIRLLPPQMREVGVIEGWAQVNVIVPFKRDCNPA